MFSCACRDVNRDRLIRTTRLIGFLCAFVNRIPVRKGRAPGDSGGGGSPMSRSEKVGYSLATRIAADGGLLYKINARSVTGTHHGLKNF